MRDRRQWRLDLAAGVLLLAGFGVALCVFSYDPADVYSTTVVPRSPVPLNFFGYPGAWLSQQLLETFGVAVHVLLASWFVLALLLFLRRNWWTWLRRLFGWVLLIPCVALAADYFGPELLGEAPLGSGGVLGAWLTVWLQENLPLAGAIVVYGVVLLLSLALALDVVLKESVQLLNWTCEGVLHTCVWLGRGMALPNPLTWLPSLALFQRKEQLPNASLVEQDDDGETISVPIAQGPTIKGSTHKIPIFHAQGHAAESATEGQPAFSINNGASNAEDKERFADFELPPITLLEDPQPISMEGQEQQLRDRAALLEKTFADFGLSVRVVGINTGPVITQYEVALATGLRVNKITNMGDDLALNLKVPSVRIVAPIPGKNTVGIEIPNEQRAIVRLKEVLLAGSKKVVKSKVPLLLGKDTEGRPLVYDLAEMPHLLIAGRTGTGKSVCMNAVILSILMTRRPDEVKMIMIDPKMLEMSEYSRIPHLMHPVVKDMKKAEAILAWAVDKMEERYDLMSRARVRNLAGYNALTLEEIHRRVKPEEEEKARIPEKMPFIVIFIDEMADLMMQMRKEVEGHIIRLAAKSRAAGIHLVVATQKPTVDVITGLIKSNLPARICFQVASRSDSRVVLDEMGADKLLGKGDMLFLQPGTSSIIRAQGAYASDEEIERVVAHLECDPCYDHELVHLNTNSGEGKGNFIEMLRARDDVYEQAIDVVVREGRGSVSLIQRALAIGYGRAARLIDFMEQDGIVGDHNGSNAREVLYTPEHWEELRKAQ